jgi:hypothetical protein
VFHSDANPFEQLLTARAQPRRIREPALALDVGACAFNGMSGQECALAAYPPEHLRLVGLGRHGDFIELADRARAVVFGVRQFRRNQRPQNRQLGARIRGNRGERLARLRLIAGRDPLVGALQLEIVVVRRRRRR